MKTVVIWGAASGLGAAMVEYFYKQSFNIVGIVRTPSKCNRLTELGIKILTCDATNAAQVNQTVKKLPVDAWVISTMGTYGAANIPVDYIGHRNLIDALEYQNINRFLLVTSLGCGDSWQYLSKQSKQNFGSAVREKSLAEVWLKSSSLDYTILRPAGLKDGEITHRGELSQKIEVHGLINRNEVTRLTHLLLNDPNSIGQIYQCVDKTLTY
jgi:nucleoside-diphosphate-sugar epimerase